MKSRVLFAAMLSTTAVIAPAHAQQTASPISSEEAASLRAEVQKLRDEVAAMKAAMVQPAPAVDQAPTQATVAAATASWKGAPQWEDKASGWSFKPRGRIQYDAGYISAPDGITGNRNLGFNSRIRRLRLGAEGTVPGGFGYKIDVDFANSTIGFGDAILTYAPANQPFSVTIGNHETHNGIEQQSSTRWSSFIERAQINDAFINTRRLGLSAGYRSKDNLFRFDVGAFTGHSIDASVDNDGWIAAARATYSPATGDGFLHLGLNYQHREFQSNNNGVASVSTGAPSTNQIARYRARPFLQTTDQRFVDTGSFAASGDDIFGVEAYGVFKSLHLGGEAQLIKVTSYAPGSIRAGLDAFNGGSVVTPTGNPSFWGGHFEVGYFLTGETRGYRNGMWDRTKVLKPFNKGGWGALQIVGRLDYLDIDDSKLIDGATTNFGTGAQTIAPIAIRQARGGRQTGYLLGLTWIPTDYVRFLFNFIHTDVEGGAFAAAANPISSNPINQRSFSTDAFALRTQVDF